MSFFGSLYTGTNGIIAQSQSTSMISTNIANINTTGFKRSEAHFSELVARETHRSPYIPGATRASEIQRIAQQGSIQQTSSTLETAINGNGFFPVRESFDGSGDVLYTRNGTFDIFAIRSTPDAQPGVQENAGEVGYLRNAAGQYLYGWPIDENGNLPGNLDDVGSLEAVIANQPESTFRATSTIEFAANLDAETPVTDPHLTGQTLPVSQQSSWDPINQVSIDNSEPLDFSRTMEIYDAEGTERNLTFEFRKVFGPMAHFSSNLGTSLNVTDTFDPVAGAPLLPGISDGDSFTITVGANTKTYTFRDDSNTNDPAAGTVVTVDGLLDAINSQGVANPGDPRLLEASLTNDGNLIVRASSPNTSVNISDVSGAPLAALNLNIDPITGNNTNFAPDNNAYGDQTDFPPYANTTDPNTRGWWEMRVLRGADPSLPNTDPLYQQPVELSKGLVNFNGDGTLNALDGELTLPSIDFDASNGNENLAAISVDMTGMTQQAGGNNVISADQNGAPLGDFAGTDITNSGIVRGRYTNGLTLDLYQIPVATFINANGLHSISGTAFRESQDSGPVTLNISGTNGAGNIVPSHIEGSNVDIGDEFARLIVSQRAFQANSRVITTVDQMTENLGRLKG